MFFNVKNSKLGLGLCSFKTLWISEATGNNVWNEMTYVIAGSIKATAH